MLIKLSVDTEDLYTEATQQIVCQYGKDYTWDLKTKVMGFVGKDVAVTIVNALELPITPDEYLVTMQKIVGELFLTCKFLPGWRSHKHFIISPDEINRTSTELFFKICIFKNLFRLLFWHTGWQSADAVHILPLYQINY